MKSLSPEARAILSASEHEQGPSSEVLGRMRTSVLGRVAAGGAVLVGTSVSAKAGAALGGTLAQVIGSGLAGALAAAALVTVSQVWPENGSASRPTAVGTAPVARITTESRLAEPRVPSQERTAETPETPPVRAARRDPEAASQPVVPLEAKPSSRSATLSKSDMPEPSEGLARAVTSGITSERAPPPPAAPTPAPVAAPLEDVDVLAREAPPRGIAPSVPSDEARAKDRLSAQLQLLRTVRALLRDQQPHRVLDLLSQPAALAEGPFEEELRTARIASLCRLGRQSEAHREIEAFLRRWPGSPLAGRLRAGCSVQ